MKKHWLVILFLFLFFLAIFYKIVFRPTPFYDWDESLYVQTGKEMIEQKKFFMPVWQGQYWLDKPPLVPLLYGVLVKFSFGLLPEITTRLFSLIVSVAVLAFVYIFYNRVLKNNLLATMAMATTALTPLFLQRAQTVNLDIFILFGWLGYVIFFDNFFASLFFLFIAVMDKSLIGFYPAALMFIYYIYTYITGSVKKKQFFAAIKQIILQGLILLAWFAGMLLIFGKQFWAQHIIESHFRRVTSSIEFHFGERIFYVTEAIKQMGYFFYLAVLGGIITLIAFLRKKLSARDLFVSFYLLPWFIFLNLTKTKIFWYFYPAIPLFAYLSFAWIKQINKKSLAMFLTLGLAGILIYQSFIATNVLATSYSKPEFYYYLSLEAKKNCQTLEVLINAVSRESFATLDKLGLLITTTKWWGEHPSMVYYFGKRINFYYDTKEFDKAFAKAGCFVIDQGDDKYLKGFQGVPKKYGDYYLLKSNF